MKIRKQRKNPNWRAEFILAQVADNNWLNIYGKNILRLYV